MMTTLVGWDDCLADNGWEKLAERWWQMGGGECDPFTLRAIRNVAAANGLELWLDEWLCCYDYWNEHDVAIFQERMSENRLQTGGYPNAREPFDGLHTIEVSGIMGDPEDRHIEFAVHAYMGNGRGWYGAGIDAKAVEGGHLVPGIESLYAFWSARALDGLNELITKAGICTK